MTTSRYKLTIVALIIALLAAIIIPLVRSAELPYLSLAADSQMEIGCTTKLTAELQDQRATLRCAAPGDLTTGAAQHVDPPFVPIAPAADAAPEPASAAKPIF